MASEGGGFWRVAHGQLVCATRKKGCRRPGYSGLGATHQCGEVVESGRSKRPYKLSIHPRMLRESTAMASQLGRAACWKPSTRQIEHLHRSACGSKFHLVLARAYVRPRGGALACRVALRHLSGPNARNRNALLSRGRVLVAEREGYEAGSLRGGSALGAPKRPPPNERVARPEPPSPLRTDQRTRERPGCSRDVVFSGGRRAATPPPLPLPPLPLAGWLRVRCSSQHASGTSKRRQVPRQRGAAKLTGVGRYRW